MKLYVASDLHLEFGNDWKPLDIDYDVLVLAGDIHKTTKGFRRYRGWNDRRMVYVAGNHEFYRQNLPATLREFQGLRAESELAGSFFLEKSSAEIDGVRFLGCTLWTDFLVHGEALQADAMTIAGDEMSDYSSIVILKDGPTKVKLAPDDTLRLHQQSRAWLERELAKPHDGPTVVVTHHAPSIRSVERYRSDLISAAYASNLEALIERYQPALWIHGHSHTACDYQIGQTRVVCNPRGYPAETFTGFRPRLVIEIPSDKGDDK